MNKSLAFGAQYALLYFFASYAILVLGLLISINGTASFDLGPAFLQLGHTESNDNGFVLQSGIGLPITTFIVGAIATAYYNYKHKK
jgi:hypothetical protein